MTYRPDFILLLFILTIGAIGPAFFSSITLVINDSESDTFFRRLRWITFPIAAAASLAYVVAMGFELFSNSAYDWQEVSERENILAPITHINPPKHFYISFMDEERNVEVEHVYVSKHFNRWRELGLGDEIAVTRNTVINRRGWLVEKLSLHTWPLFNRCFFKDSEIGGVEYAYSGAREGVEKLLRD